MIKFGFWTTITTLVLSFIFFTGFGLYFIYQDYSVHNHYKQTYAKVISSEIFETYTIPKGSNNKIYRYSPLISYKYRINSQDYSSDRYSLFTTESKDQNDIADLLKGYQDSMEIIIYYNPDKPQEAVIKQESSLVLSYVFISLGLFMGILAAVLLFLPKYLKNRK